MAIAWRVVADDYGSPYVGQVPMPRYEPPVERVQTPPGTLVEYDASGPHPHGDSKRGIWAWREESFDAARQMQEQIAGSRLLELEYDDPDDVVLPRRRERDGVAVILRRCRVVRELDLLERFIVLAAGHATNPDSRIHGVDHWRRVGENGATLAADTPGADGRVIAAFSALHDSQRFSDGRDPQHGARAAELARDQSRGLRLWYGQLETLCAALVDHDRGRISDDPTIGCCWDSDRLDLVRLGMRVRPELLSTEAGRRLAR
jgi:uncharacterized protein